VAAGDITERILFAQKTQGGARDCLPVPQEEQVAVVDELQATCHSLVN